MDYIGDTTNDTASESSLGMSLLSNSTYEFIDQIR